MPPHAAPIDPTQSVSTWFASEVRRYRENYETQVIPGLLQTEAYAREISLAAHGKRTPEERVTTRMERQQILDRKNPPRLWILLDAPVLHRMVGGPEVMKEQSEHLLKMAERPNIVIQAIPADTHVHAGLCGSYQIFTLRDGEDVGWSEMPGIGWFFDQPDAVRDLAVRFDLTRASALPVEAALDLIRRLAEQL